MFKILICMSVIFHISIGNFRNSVLDDELLKEDERVYNESNVFGSTYGECWHRAVEDLHGGCKELTAAKHRELALEFSNCFLRSSGLEADACENKPLKECLSNDRTLSTFTHFFLRTRSICQSLEHKMWQKKTLDFIVKQSENSVILSSQIEEAKEKSSMFLHVQNLALEKQEKLLRISDLLSKELEEVHSSAKNLKLITSKHVKLVSPMLESIKHLEFLFIAEHYVVFTMLFYLSMLTASYILTSTPFTLPARLVLFVVFILSAIIERSIITKYSIQDELEERLPLDTKGPLYTRIWLLRKTAFVVAVSVLIFSSFKYHHDVRRHAQLLGQLRRQQMEMLDIVRETDVKVLQILAAVHANEGDDA